MISQIVLQKCCYLSIIISLSLKVFIIQAINTKVARKNGISSKRGLMFVSEDLIYTWPYNLFYTVRQPIIAKQCFHPHKVSVFILKYPLVLNTLLQILNSVEIFSNYDAHLLNILKNRHITKSIKFMKCLKFERKYFPYGYKIKKS